MNPAAIIRQLKQVFPQLTSVSTKAILEANSFPQVPRLDLYVRLACAARELKILNEGAAHAVALFRREFPGNSTEGHRMLLKTLIGELSDDDCLFQLKDPGESSSELELEFGGDHFTPPFDESSIQPIFEPLITCSDLKLLSFAHLMLNALGSGTPAPTTEEGMISLPQAQAGLVEFIESAHERAGEIAGHALSFLQELNTQPARNIVCGALKVNVLQITLIPLN